MAIEAVKKTILLVPQRQLEQLLAWLYQRAEFALEEFDELSQQERLPLRPNRFSRQLAQVNEKLAKAERILQAASLFSQQNDSFIDRLLPLKTVVTPQQLHDIITDFDLDGLAEKAAELELSHNRITRRLRELTARRDELLPLASLSIPLARLQALTHFRFKLLEISPAGYEKARVDEELQQILAIQHIFTSPENLLVAAFWIPADDEKVPPLLTRLGFKERSLPSFQGLPREELARLEREIEQAQEAQRLLESEYRELAQQHHAALVLHAYLESEKRRLEDATATSSSRRVSLVTGWALEKNIPQLRHALETDFPGVEILLEEPSPNEPAPVRLTNSNLTRPSRTLVEMFGLPDYRTFDPTPCLMIPFLVFFGFCFGDVLYGLWLTLLALYLKRRYRDQRRMFPALNLFFYAGLSTMLFGALTGAWAADLYLPEYLGANNLLGRVASRLQVLDMLADPILTLAVVIGIGIANQFWAIMLAFYREARRGDWFSALVDSAAWIGFFTGLLLLLVNQNIALALLAVSGLTLVLFQGRREKSLPGRIITGLVSLYGILGTYGATAFLGDVVSYSRLMALGLTTNIIGSAVNIIAGLTRETPYLGWPLFFLVLLAGHVFNFFVSVLGAFVHSARLILLEFFGRFYQGGARPFIPYGFRSDQLDILHAGQTR